MASITDGTSNTFAVGEAIPAWSAWSWWYNENAAVATCALPLNYRKGIDKLDQFATSWQRNYSFYSLHPAGANFAMCDASVRFIPDNIDTPTYRALATVEAGDVISTGTPGGIGYYADPKIFLKGGDVVEIEVDGIGVLRNRVVGEQGAKQTLTKDAEQ
jgi:prepilin-type processing-associated H-X9-DG protein